MIDQIDICLNRLMKHQTTNLYMLSYSYSSSVDLNSEKIPFAIFWVFIFDFDATGLVNKLSLKRSSSR